MRQDAYALPLQSERAGAEACDTSLDGDCLFSCGTGGPAREHASLGPGPPASYRSERRGQGPAGTEECQQAPDNPSKNGTTNAGFGSSEGPGRCKALKWRAVPVAGGQRYTFFFLTNCYWAGRIAHRLRSRTGGQQSGGSHELHGQAFPDGDPAVGLASCVDAGFRACAARDQTGGDGRIDSRTKQI